MRSQKVYLGVPPQDLPHWRMSLWNRTPNRRTHPPALSSPRQPTKPDMAGGSGVSELQEKLWGCHHDLEKTMGFIMVTGLQIWLHDWRDLNAEEEEQEPLHVVSTGSGNITAWQHHTMEQPSTNCNRQRGTDRQTCSFKLLNVDCKSSHFKIQFENEIAKRVI